MSIDENIKAAVREVFNEYLPHLKAQPTLPEGSLVITSKEAAALAGVSVATFSNWTHRTDCDFVVKAGRNNRILRHKFLEWLDRQAANRMRE